MESIIDDLATKAGVDRGSLYMAWDFTVASQESVTGRATTIRDDAFARLGDTNLAEPHDRGRLRRNVTYQPGDDPPVATPADPPRRGHLEVPCYLDKADCATGGEFQFTDGGQLTWDPTKEQRSRVPLQDPGLG